MPTNSPSLLAGAASLVDRLAGPRFIDAPLRLLALAVALLGLPVALSPPFLSIPTMTAAAIAVLILCAPWWPRTTLVIALLVQVTLTALFPWSTWMSTAVLFAIGMVLTYGSWRFAAIAGAITSVVDAAQGLVWRVSIGESLVSSTAGLALVALLGLAAHAAESRIEAETQRRIVEARKHEQDIAAERLDMAADAHDTVSHTLSTESAILTVLAHQRAQGNEIEPRTLLELGLVNAQGQRQLRRLLSRLRGPGHSSVTLDDDFAVAADAIAARSTAADVPLVVQIHEVPGRVPPELAESLTMALFELATNVIKHGVAEQPARIDITTENKEWGEVVVLTSLNEASASRDFTPRTLAQRSAQHGGLCTVLPVGEASVQVTVSIAVDPEPQWTESPA